jgi:hypothetical protein
VSAARMGDDGTMDVPELRAFEGYLRVAGWSLEDRDARTSLWRAESPAPEPLVVVLPARQDVRDYADVVDAAIRTVAFAERRLPEEIRSDISFGGADTVAVRLTPDAPSGEVPLTLARQAVTALHDFVVGSAAAIEIHDLVLPSHRPLWAESYASRVRLSTHPGSFVLSLALPLVVDLGDVAAENETVGGQMMFEVPPQPFGRRVSARMLSAAQSAQRLADDVNAGIQPLRAFGADPLHPTANATELAALKALGGPEFGLYQLRFSQSPLAGGNGEPVTLGVTPGQQRVLGEAADFLRTRQPRSGVTVQGLVVRLHRSGAFGPGEVVIEGIDDDSGTTRRYRMELPEDDYNDALRAHRNGLQVSVTGDREERGTHLHLRRLSSFSVIPGLEYEDF